MNENYNTLLTPLIEKEKEQNTNSSNIIGYLNILEGCKTRIKNLHWAATNMPIHEYLDDFLDIVNNYQDSIAEELMGINGQLPPNVIVGTLCEDIEVLTLLDSLKNKTNIFYANLRDNIEYVGVKGEIESFIHQINKYLYLFRIAKTQ